MRAHHARSECGSGLNQNGITESELLQVSGTLPLGMWVTGRKVLQNFCEKFYYRP